MTYTLIDIPNGTVIHTETHQSAVRIRKVIGAGVIVRDDSPIYSSLITAARKHMNQSKY